MSDSPKCPTCGSNQIPECIRMALTQVRGMDPSRQDSIVLILQHLYLHGDPKVDQTPPLECAMRDVLRKLSENTYQAVAALGSPDPVYVFFRAEFGEPE